MKVRIGPVRSTCVSIERYQVWIWLDTFYAPTFSTPRDTQWYRLSTSGWDPLGLHIIHWHWHVSGWARGWDKFCYGYTFRPYGAFLDQMNPDLLSLVHLPWISVFSSRLFCIQLVNIGFGFFSKANQNPIIQTSLNTKRALIRIQLRIQSARFYAEKYPDVLFPNLSAPLLDSDQNCYS